MFTDLARRTPTAAAIAGAVVVGLAAVPPAAAAQLECGDTITADTQLTHDLTCEEGDGLIIGADDVVLDLEGFTISGAGAYAPGVGAGVRATRVTGTEVRNGTIRGFDAAVVLNEAWDATVWNLKLHDSYRGINIAGGGSHLIEKNTITDNGDGIRLGLSTGNVVQKNTLSGNTYGIGVANSSSDNMLSKNTVTTTSTDGIWVTPASTGTTIEKNRVESNLDDGIDVDSTSATLIKNFAVHNGDLGIEAAAGVTDGGGNHAAGNGDPAQCTGVTCGPATGPRRAGPGSSSR